MPAKEPLNKRSRRCIQFPPRQCRLSCPNHQWLHAVLHGRGTDLPTHIAADDGREAPMEPGGNSAGQCRQHGKKGYKRNHTVVHLEHVYSPRATLSAVASGDRLQSCIKSFIVTRRADVALHHAPLSSLNDILRRLRADRVGIRFLYLLLSSHGNQVDRVESGMDCHYPGPLVQEYRHE